MACQSWSKSVGGDGSTDGSINIGSSVNLSAEQFSLPGDTQGFRDVHSAQFVRDIQTVKAFYDQLLDTFNIPRIQP